jgi:hypothetical protein
MQGPLKSSNQMQKQKPFLRPHKRTPTTTVKELLRERHCRNLIRNRRRGVTNSSYKRYLLSKIKPQRNTEIITHQKPQRQKYYKDTTEKIKAEKQRRDQEQLHLWRKKLMEKRVETSELPLFLCKGRYFLGS